MLTTVILAAGEGKRMKSKHSKVLHKVCGLPLIEWVMRAAPDGSRKIVVVGHCADEVKEAIGDRAEYALQAEQKGTGHAVMQAEALLKEQEGTVLILSGDVPMITKETLEDAYAFHCGEKNAVTVLTAKVDNPFGYGRVLRSQSGGIEKIVEQKDATAEEAKTNEVNSGMYFFEVPALLEALHGLSCDNAQGEYYLTDTIGLILKAGLKAGGYVMEDSAQMSGINDRIQLAEAEQMMRRRLVYRLMQEGVTVTAPETVYVGADVKVGRDSIILPNTMLEGNTVIGEDTLIGPNSRIVDSVIGDGTEVQSSVILQSEIGAAAHVGPFAYVRPNSKIGDHTKIGDFVEIKNATIGNGTKVSHLTYVGDADVGDKVNFGCGTVLVNYDGKKKYRSTIGDQAFIGCNTNLVSPVTVGNGAFIAAGSTITEDVPPETLAIARSRQTIKENWNDRRKR